METVTWRGFSSLARLALIGLGVAFAGALLSVLLGIGSSSAHADDGEAPGPAGALTGFVADATTRVGATVAEVSSTATDVVSTITGAMPDPVEQPVRAVVRAVDEVVPTVVEPVGEAAPDGIVTTVTQPVLGIVGSVPVVAEVADALGVDDAVTALGSSVDDVLETSLAAVTDTTTAIGSLPSGEGIPGIDGTDSSRTEESTVIAVAISSGAADPAGPVLASSAPFAASLHTAPARAASIPAFAPSTPSGAPPGALCLSALAGSASGGSGSGAWALAALLPFAAHRAWVRRPGSPSDAAPAAPFFDTDVSPD